MLLRMRSCAVLFLSGAVLCAHAEPSEPPTMTHPVPAQKGLTPAALAALRERGTQRVYRGDALQTLGMPCGGICAGQLYIRGDGTLACWQIDGGNYFGGVGHTSYRTYTPDQPIAQGFALAARDAAGAVTRVTLDKAGYDAIEFVGGYPRAIIRYRAKDQQVPPVKVDLEVLTPFIPLDARNSAWPATVLRFTLENPTNQPLDVALGGWLQNMTFAELPHPVTVRRVNSAKHVSGVNTLLLAAEPVEFPTAAQPQRRVLADFEDGTYAGWTARGKAFGDKPADGTWPGQQPVSGFTGDHLVNSYYNPDMDRATGELRSEPFTIDQPLMTFRIGGGEHPGLTCLNLLVDGQIVRTATGRNYEQLDLRAWDLRPYAGRQARLQILDTHQGAWGHINIDDIALTNTLPEELQEYSEEALGRGTMALSVIGDGDVAPDWNGQESFVDALAGVSRSDIAASDSADAPPTGSVTTRLKLAPHETCAVTFLVTWHFPNLHTRNGRMYANWYRDAQDVAVQLAGQLDTLTTQTHLFCDTYYRDTTLPWWLNARLMMPVANLATNTAQWWKNGRFWAWEGVCCCEGTCTHVWNYAQAHAWLFPELARSARTMQDLGEAFHSINGLVGFRGDRNFAADGQAGTVLKCYREYLTAADDTFLKTYWLKIKLVLDYLISQDADENGVIENDRQHNTYDINFVGANTFVGSLYLAALRAGEEMATHMGDTSAARRYRRIFERGQQWTSQKLFNGEYFQQEVPKGDERPFQYGSGCLSDQVFGQNWAHLLNLGYVYPEQQVQAALAAVYKYNWAPDVNVVNAAFTPERWFARAGEPGLLICTWPHGGRPGEPVRYRDEIWTGIEYQVAAGLAWEGQVDEALALVHGIEQRYDGTHHNPWNEVECGDHYARALASWGVLHALAGFTWDGPAGRLGFAPRLTPDTFACFFSTGTAWGTLRQERTGDQQTDTFAVRYGQLRLTQVTLDTPVGGSNAATATIQQDGREQPVSVQRAADQPHTVLRFDPPLTLQAGQSLCVQLK